MLHPGSSVFVADVFKALKHHLYRPGAAPPPSTEPSQVALPALPLGPHTGPPSLPAPTAPRQNGSKKRPFHETSGWEPQNLRGGPSYGRVHKQPRRLGFGARGGRMGDMANSRRLLPSFPYTPNFALPPQDMSQFDPNNHVLGPFMPTPPFPLPMPGFPQIPYPGLLRAPLRHKKICRDFQTNKFCRRPNCPFEHVFPTEDPPPDGRCRPRRTCTAVFLLYANFWTEYDPRQALMDLGDGGNAQPLVPMAQAFRPSPQLGSCRQVTSGEA